MRRTYTTMCIISEGQTAARTMGIISIYRATSTET